jgi:signal peptidase I
LTTIGVLIIGLELAGRIFLYQSFYLPGASMSPTLNLGDRFWAEKFAYFASNPERGDVVVFDVKGRAFVKRIVGLPGDRIQMQHGKLYLNGAPLPQHRVADFAMDCAKGLCDVHQDAEIMPNGHSYNVFDMVNDGREDNTSVFVVPAENYFVLGDNRDNSDDSRVDLGFVPLSSIRGRATLKYIDARSGKYVWQTIN